MQLIHMEGDLPKVAFVPFSLKVNICLKITLYVDNLYAFL